MLLSNHKFSALTVAYELIVSPLNELNLISKKISESFTYKGPYYIEKVQVREVGDFL